ncbi:MAG TPA: endo-1,4-beta-xylanase [Chitinophagaceae bacterium]|nr:endo-1,4-beta-xylanase [Chitinophagaceae bacterium]
MKYLSGVGLAAIVVLFTCSITKRQTDKTLQNSAPFPIGVAANVRLLLHNAAYRRVVLTEFNSITSENALKWTTVHPDYNRFDFSAGDSLVKFALDNHKRVHGHNLVWIVHNPSWLNYFKGDSAAWENLLKTHIQTVVSHYKGKITGWDVVNEAFLRNGNLAMSGGEGNGKNNANCIWPKLVGRDYVARCFIYAHQADPAALLFYNDYGQEVSPAKVSAIINMVTDFKRRSIPINGLGLQMHLTLATPKSGITYALKKLAGTGLLIHISELDISTNQNNQPNFLYSDDVQQKQADLFAFVVQQYKLLVPEKQQYGITLWDLGDGDSWIRGTYKRMDWPLLFDEKYDRKPVYNSFQKALQLK